MSSTFRKIGREIAVNSFTTGDQGKPNIAADPASGGFQIVWQSFGQDGDGWGVYAQAFGANGRSQGPEIRVNTLTIGDQTTPDVAFNEEGNGVWIWESNAILEEIVVDPDTGRTRVADYGDEPSAFEVANSIRTHTKIFGFEGEDFHGVERERHGGHIPEDDKFSLDPRVISLGGDQFGAGSRDNDIARGGSQYLVDEFSAFTPPTVPRNGDWSRNFAEDEVTPRGQTTFGDIGQVDEDTIVAVNAMTSDFDGSMGIIQFQFFDRPDDEGERGLAFGLSDRFELEGSGTTGPAAMPRVAVLQDGAFAIVWEEEDQRAADESDWNTDLYVQIFETDGTPRSPVVPVHDASGADQSGPEIAAVRDGGFVVAYEEARGANVLAQRFDETGVRIGPAEVVNRTRPGEQGEVAIDTLANGRLVVAWQSETGDGDGTGVVAQRLALQSTSANRPNELVGTDANERFNTGGRDDIVDGAGGRDVVRGGGGDDLLRGGDGNDQLDGARGRDRLFGDDGRDILEGGRGDDIMEGGADADVFIHGRRGGDDVIVDFEPDVDRVDLSDLGLSARQLVRSASQGPDGVTGDFGRHGTLTIEGVSFADLSAGDFII